MLSSAFAVAACGLLVSPACAAAVLLGDSMTSGLPASAAAPSQLRSRAFAVASSSAVLRNVTTRDVERRCLEDPPVKRRLVDADGMLVDAPIVVEAHDWDVRGRARDANVRLHPLRSPFPHADRPTT